MTVALMQTIVVEMGLKIIDPIPGVDEFTLECGILRGRKGEN